jgi:hypothetical protein
MEALLLGYLFSFARRTITQALIALGLTEHDWSDFYRLFSEPRLAYEALSGCFLHETLTHMPGPHRAQRFLHLAALLPRTGEGYSRALPLRWEPAFPEKAVLPEGMESRKQWEAAGETIRWLRERLDEAGRASQRLLVIGDGEFSGAKLRASLPVGAVLFSRCARYRALYAMPEAEEGRRGRKRKYGQKASKPHEWLSKRSGWRRTEFMVRGRPVRPRYRVEGPLVLENAAERPVFLMVVNGVHRKSGGRRRHRDPSFFLVCAERDGERWALPFSAEVLLG